MNSYDYNIVAINPKIKTLLALHRSAVPLDYVHVELGPGSTHSTTTVTSNVVFTQISNAAVFLNTVNTNPSAILASSNDVEVQVGEIHIFWDIA